jgi:hypothetical protein
VPLGVGEHLGRWVGMIKVLRGLYRPYIGLGLVGRCIRGSVGDLVGR